jgi:hypothetical protein
MGNSERPEYRMIVRAVGDQHDLYGLNRVDHIDLERSRDHGAFRNPRISWAWDGVTPLWNATMWTGQP